MVYAGGGPHPYRAPCREILDAVRVQALDATTSVEVIQEILHLYAGRGERRRAIDVARASLALFPMTLAVDVPDLEEAIELATRVGGLSARDALHAAMCLRRNLVLVSADTDFDAVRGLRRVDPREALRELSGVRRSSSRES